MTNHDLLTRGTIAIVGAGPAGLTLARLLQTRGYNVTVVERDASPTARSQGGSLDIRPSLGQRAIDAAGLTDVFARIGRSDASGFKVIDSQGIELPGVGDETHEDAGPEIDRGDLRMLLLDSLAPGTVQWDRAVTDVVRDGDRWSIEVADHTPIVADLVVGADGMGSRVRRRLTSVAPTYTGQTMVAANIRPELWHGTPLADCLGQGSIMYAGDGRTIFVQRCARELILVYYSLSVAEDWPADTGLALDDTASVLGVIRDTYADWSPVLVDMLTQVSPGFHRWPLSVMPPDVTWETQPGLTMIGDASHAMPPFTGKGVNLAMFDALELSDALAAGPKAELADTLATFEAGMQARTWRETGACLEVGRTFYGIDLGFDTERAIA